MVLAVEKEWDGHATFLFKRWCRGSRAEQPGVVSERAVVAGTTHCFVLNFLWILVLITNPFTYYTPKASEGSFVRVDTWFQNGGSELNIQEACAEMRGLNISQHT